MKSNLESFVAGYMLLLVMYLIVLWGYELFVMSRKKNKHAQVHWHVCEYCGSVSAVLKSRLHPRCSTCQLYLKREMGDIYVTDKDPGHRT